MSEAVTLHLDKFGAVLTPTQRYLASMGAVIWSPERSAVAEGAVVARPKSGLIRLRDDEGLPTGVAISKGRIPNSAEPHAARPRGKAPAPKIKERV